MVLAISAAIYLISILPVAALFRSKSLVHYLLTFFTLLLSEIVITGNLLGLFHQLNNERLWLVIQAMIALLLWGMWYVLKRPKLFPFSIEKVAWKQTGGFKKVLLILWAGILLTGYSILAFLIIKVPPNNMDSLVVHLVRVGYWLQHGSFAPWVSLIERQVIYPYNAQIIVLWTVLFHGTDHLAGFLQFFCVIFTALGIYGLATLLSARRFYSIFAAFLYLSFPQVILQASSTQDDLVITCFLVLGTYFFLSWLKGERTANANLILAAVCWSMALGIKPTSFYYFIGLALFLIVLICTKKLFFKQFLKLLSICAVCFFFLSSYAYFNNLINFRNPLGPSEFVSTESGVNSPNLVQKTLVNSGRFIYQFVSLDGLPRNISTPLQKIKESAAEKIPTLIDTSSKYVKDPNEPFTLDLRSGTNEDYSWFGILSFLFLPPAYIVGVLKAIKKRDASIAALIIIPIVYFLAAAALRPGWDPYQGRYLNPVIALCVPLVPFLFDEKVISKVTVTLATLIAANILLFTALTNDSKPLVTQASLYRTMIGYPCDKNLFTKANCVIQNKMVAFFPDRLDILPLNSLEKRTYSAPDQYAMIDQYLQLIPKDASVTLLLNNGDLEYLFFGDHFDYSLSPISTTTLEKDTLATSSIHSEYVFVHLTKKETVSLPPDYVLKSSGKGTNDNSAWKIFERQE